MYEKMTTDNCGVNPLLMLRIMERSYILPNTPEHDQLKVETHDHECENEDVIRWCYYNDYISEYDQVFNQRIPGRERI